MPTTDHAAIASVAWGDLHVRVYTQDPEGYIRQSRFDTSDGVAGEWHRGGLEERLVLAKPHTPLAAFCVNPPGWAQPAVSAPPNEL